MTRPGGFCCGDLLDVVRHFPFESLLEHQYTDPLRKAGPEEMDGLHRDSNAVETNRNYQD